MDSNNQSKDRQAVIVLGMHRSGTSAITRVLNLLGVDLGYPLIGGVEGNNRFGFWEHARAVEINNQLLSDLGRSWHDVRPLPSDWMSIRATRDASERIHGFIQDNFENSALWGLKDPRLCLLSKIWIEAVEQEGFDVLPIVILRHPEEVADSLLARDGLTKSHAYMLWGMYMCSALRSIAGRRFAIIDYASFLTHWRDDLEKSVIPCGLRLDINSNDVVSKVNDFLDVSERHNKHSSLGGEVPLSPLANSVFALYEYLAGRQGVYSEYSQSLEHLLESFELVADAVREPLRELFDHVQIHVGQVVSLQSKLAELVNGGGTDESDKIRSTLETVLTDAVENMENGLTMLQKELSCRADRNEERQLANEARWQSLDDRIHELSKQTVATELLSATKLAELNVRVEQQHAHLDEVKEGTRRLESQADVMRAGLMAQFQTLAASFDQSFAQLQDRVDSHEQTLREELVDSKAKVHELTAAFHGALALQDANIGKKLEQSDARAQEWSRAVHQAVSELRGQLDDLKGDVLVQSRNADQNASIAVRRIDLLESSQTEYVERINAESSRVMERLEGRVDAMSSSLNSRFDRLQNALEQRDGTIQNLQGELAKSTARLHDIESSTSWRVTAPLRWVRMLLMLRTWKAALGRTAKFTYDHLPLPPNRRVRLKGVVFRALSPLLRNTQSYRAWQAFEAHRGGGPLHAASARVPASTSPAPVTAPIQAADPVPQDAGHPHVSGQVLSELQNAASKVADEHVALDDSPADMSRIDVRAIAFYLPQFHPIPENDAWWGRGFTEWTNVSKAVPQFVGHYQPRLPGELGFYDLRLVDVMRRQVELAKHYGLQGFCFHYYWFGGRRLLERPLEQFLANTDIDFPFCICWANENWSRRWDGMDQDILVGQSHSPEDDVAFITALEPLLRDPRYIRVDGKPLIVLYRPSILPDAKATQRRWREHCREVGIGEIMLAMVQFDVEDPRTFDFDVAIEFPPHKLARGLDPINDQLQIVNPEYSGYVIDYGTVIERARSHASTEFNMIRGVFPSWDNEARKPGRGYTFANATPARYREWLDLAIGYAREHPVAGERLVFINAWNEWAEGAYLEPDRRYGYAYLRETRNALLASPGTHRIRGRAVAIISHDAHPHGAQYLALNLARELRSGLGLDVHVLLMSGGQLAPRFAETAHVHDLSEMPGTSVAALFGDLRKAGVELVIANTAVSGRLTELVAAAGLRVVSLVHELPELIREYGLEGAVADLLAYSDRVVLPSEAVAAGMEQFVDHKLLARKAVLRPQGLFTRSKYRGTTNLDTARANLRAKLKLPDDARIVLAVGYADRRKGVDLLLNAAAICCNRDPLLHFVWVGHTDTSLARENAAAIAKGNLQPRFHFVGMDFETDDYYAGADIYALTSREDPFPSVVLEALSVGIPVVAFAGTGGGADLVRRGGGVVVPAFDIAKYADAITGLLANDAERKRLGSQGSDIVDAEFSFRAYAMDLLHFGGLQIPRVSVVVPNFNYARYLRERLESITNQTVPVYEIIFLDDKSDDHSVEVIQELRHSLSPEPRILVNHTNSGSVFLQWHRGVQLARGDYVWIAEADDLAKPDFLERILERKLPR